MPKYEEKELSSITEDPLEEYKKSIFDRYKWYITHLTQLLSMNELLLMNSDVLVHQRHLRFLVTEVSKYVNNLNLHFMWVYFKMNFSHMI